MRYLILAIAIVGLGGCAEQSEQKYADRANVEGKADAESETNEINKRAQQMEIDLARFQNFFEGVAGTYEGKMRTPRGKIYRVRFAIAATIPRYEGSRIRTPDEIAYDTNNMAFEVLENTITTLEDGQELSFGCQYEKIKPAMDAGSIRLFDADCPRSFSLSLIPSGVGLQDQAELQVSARKMASALLEKRGNQAVTMQVEMRSINLPDPLHFIVERKK